MNRLSRVSVIVAAVVLVFFAVTMRFPAIQGSAALSVAQGLDPNHGCEYCHDLHGGAGYYALTLASTVEATCLSCHDGQNPLYPQAPVVTVHENKEGSAYAPFRMSCASCHTPHNDSDTNNEDLNKNIKLINATISTPNSGDRAVIFENLLGPSNGTMADGDTLDLDGVCEVCHTQTTNHRGVLPGTASDHGHGPAKARCTTCHSHDNKFKGAGGRCTSCHSDGTAGAPIVVSQFERTSHHIDWESFAAPNNVVDSIPDSDCTTCHNPLHDGSTDNIRFKNFDTAGDIQLAADPFTDATARGQVTIFCLACHDDAGNASTTPFSDGVTRPERDSTEFFLSGHQTNGQQCLDCHGSGHGSQKQNILGTSALPATASADSGFGSLDATYFEEEGFCFDCHTSIETFFGTSILWTQEAAGENANLNLNDRHDVQYEAQAQSGAKIECVSCHDPHAANQTMLVRPDPDPGDGRVPALDQVLPGMNFMSQWCMDCHDDAFPSGITAPTVAIVDIRANWSATKGKAASNMGSGGSNGASLEPASGYTANHPPLECLACHGAHSSDRSNHNLYQLRDTVYNVSGTNALETEGGGFNYYVTDVTPPGSAAGASVNGWNWCNTCHDNSMSNWGTNCMDHHTHGGTF